MARVFIEVPGALLQCIDKLCDEKLKTLGLSADAKPPISQIAWLETTPEGKRFMGECVQHKYAKLDQDRLNKLAVALYYETYGLKPPGPGRPQTKPSISKTELRNMVIVELLTAATGFAEAPVLAVNNE